MKVPAGKQVIIFIALTLACSVAGAFMLTCSAQVAEPPAVAEPSNSRTEITVDDELQLLHLQISLPEWIGKKKIDLDPKRRPLLAFRAWASGSKPFFPSFLFCFAVGILAWSVCPAKLAQAVTVCRQRFWRSLFSGILACVILLLLARCLFIMEIGTPLANVTVALLELTLLIGLSVTAAVVGQAALSRTGLDRQGWLKDRHCRRRLIELSIGSMLFAALLAIPAAGGIPPIGIRVAVLLCQLGIGACLHVYTSTRSGSDALL